MRKVILQKKKKSIIWQHAFFLNRVDQTRSPCSSVGFCRCVQVHFQTHDFLYGRTVSRWKVLFFHLIFSRFTESMLRTVPEKHVERERLPGRESCCFFLVHTASSTSFRCGVSFSVNFVLDWYTIQQITECLRIFLRMYRYTHARERELILLCVFPFSIVYKRKMTIYPQK